jgi:hypothetical protein
MRDQRARRACTPRRTETLAHYGSPVEATYRVEQRHFWWTGLRSFTRPLVADALAGRLSRAF